MINMAGVCHCRCRSMLGITKCHYGYYIVLATLLLLLFVVLALLPNTGSYQFRARNADKRVRKENVDDVISEPNLLVHMVWTTTPQQLHEIAILAIRSVCKFHPRATLIFWIVNHNKFRERPPAFKCDVQYKTLDLKTLFRRTPISEVQ